MIRGARRTRRHQLTSAAGGDHRRATQAECEAFDPVPRQKLSRGLLTATAFTRSHGISPVKKAPNGPNTGAGGTAVAFKLSMKAKLIPRPVERVVRRRDYKSSWFLHSPFGIRCFTFRR